MDTVFEFLWWLILVANGYYALTIFQGNYFAIINIICFAWMINYRFGWKNLWNRFTSWL